LQKQFFAITACENKQIQMIMLVSFEWGKV